MKKFLIVISFSFLSITLAQAQASAGYLRMGGLGQVITSKSRKSGYIGAIYMDTAWRKANMTVYNSDQVLTGIPVKYEIKANEIEVRAAGEIKIIDVSKVNTLDIFDALERLHHFVNGKDFTIKGVPFGGLLEVIYKGKISLYKQYSYYIIASNKNDALSTGTNDDTPKAESFVYYTTGTDLQKVPKKKKLLAIFGDKMPVMETYIKQNDLDPSNQADLVAILEHYNTL